MAKIILTLLALLVSAFTVLAMYCALVVASRYDEYDVDEGDDEMFWKRQICPKCKTGKECFDLDRRSEICPYIECWNKGKCPFFASLDSSTKRNISKIKKNKTKIFSFIKK